MRESVHLVQGLTQILRNLLTHSRSQIAAIVIFTGMAFADFVFRKIIFPSYANFLQNNGFQPKWAELDAGFGPIIWLIVFAFILGSLTIVISFAAQNVPKLIDLYMDHWPSLFFVWWTLACLVHSLILFYLSQSGVDVFASVIFNYHFLILFSMVIGFPFILVILKSSKTANVIENLLNGSFKSINRLSEMGSGYQLSPSRQAKVQHQLFEELNQLMDLLVYVPYKEPKAQIIIGIGDLLRHYIGLKPSFPDNFFQVNKIIEDDISFRTMKQSLPEVTKTRTFFEQKSFRLIGNVYNTFLEAGEFDLSTLCVEQLSRVGKTAINLQDEALVEVINIRLNTHFRFALKHSQQYNEPRNLYNLVFHYGQFLECLAKHKDINRIKTCLGYFVFYGQQCFLSIPRAPSLGFILDTLAAEMQKLMIQIYTDNWEIELQKEFLLKFLLFDNFQDMEESFVINFFSKNHGIRLLHIGLALFYLEQNEKDFALLIAKDTMQDIDLLGMDLFNQNMKTIFARLKFSGPKFWEDTDRGNLNIYYTPYASQIDHFQLMQKDCQNEKSKLIPA